MMWVCSFQIKFAWLQNAFRSGSATSHKYISYDRLAIRLRSQILGLHRCVLVTGLHEHAPRRAARPVHKHALRMSISCTMAVLNR